MFTTAFVALALCTSALADVFITSPTAQSTFTGGQTATISWQDSGSGIPLSQFGPAQVSIYVGNVNQQTQLQIIASNVVVSANSSINFTPDPTIGPDSAAYFIRFESPNATDPINPQLAFSAKFTMAGMTGNFSAAVQSQIDGASTAPIGGSTLASPVLAGSPTPTPAPSAPTSASKAPSSSSASSASSSAKASTTANSNGASTLAATSGAAMAVVAIAVLGNMFF